MAHYKNGGQLIINTTQRTQKFLELEPRPFKVYLQFGKGKAGKERPRVVVNWVKGLKKTRNKPLQQRLLNEAGLRVPQFFEYDEALEYIRETGNPIVRKAQKHSRCKGMKRFFEADNFAEWLRNYGYPGYCQEYKDMNREWRIHVSAYQDEPVIAYRKCFRGEVVEQYRNDEIEKPWYRNHDICYFKLDGIEEDKEPWFDDMVAECKRAIEVLDMDIAGVDVGENNKIDGGDFVIYEVNSACGMEEHTRACYEQAIEHIVDVKAQKKGLI